MWNWPDNVQNFRLKKMLIWSLTQDYRIGEKKKTKRKKNETNLITLKAFDWKWNVDLIVDSELPYLRKNKKKKLNNWSIVRKTIRLKIHIRMLERIRLIASIQYTKNLLMLSLVISLLGTSIESQTSKSISFYSWQRIITRMRMTRWSTDTSTESQISSSISINFEWFNSNQRWCNSEKKS